MFNAWVSFSVLIRSLSCNTCCDTGPQFLWFHSKQCNRLVQRTRMTEDQIYSRIHMGLVASYKVCFLSRQMLAFLCNNTIMFLQLMCFRTLYFFILRKICKISYNFFDWFCVVYFLFEYISLISVILHVQRSATDHSAAITFCKKKKQAFASQHTNL